MPATINGTSGFGGNLTGNVTGNADTATTAGKFSTTSGDAPTYACRAWVNFDGTKDTTGAASTANTNRLIRSSGNVASVLRNGTGDYTVTFTTAMPDANYAVQLSSEMGGGNGGFNGVTNTPAVGSVRFVAYTQAGALRDISLACVAIFR
jgi:hypothetical protein